MAIHESVSELTDDELRLKLDKPVIAPEFKVLKC